MKSEIINTLAYSNNIIISPDVDGFYSASLMHRENPLTRIVGTYDKNILCLADGYEANDCLFVDCDMNTKEYISIGNHMRLSDDNISPRSFNPNNHYGVKRYSEKFPYATCYLIAYALDMDTDEIDHNIMGFADSTHKNLENYKENMYRWGHRMPHKSVQAVLDGLVDVSGVAENHNYKQSQISRRVGKDKYLLQVNQELSVYTPVHSDSVKTFKKFQKGLVDKNTLVRYMDDIISYAEIFGGEYSVTYKDEV